MTAREQWFKDRIGKRIFRVKSTCPCNTCKDNYDNGLVVLDELHAEYLRNCEAEMTEPYFDTKEEVKQFEDSLK